MDRERGRGRDGTIIARGSSTMTRRLGVGLLGAMLVACGDDGAEDLKIHDLHDPGADAAPCSEAELHCGDQTDDDCDTRVDCADADCAGDGACVGAPCSGPALPEACWDAWDDDCDGLPDCADDDCARSVQCNTSCRCLPGAARFCDAPASSTWGRQTCDAEGSWGPCTETADRPAPCAGTHYDPECCAAAAEACCQDAPASGSIGECGGIVTCS